MDINQTLPLVYGLQLYIIHIQVATPECRHSQSQCLEISRIPHGTDNSLHGLCAAQYV